MAEERKASHPDTAYAKGEVVQAVRIDDLGAETLSRSVYEHKLFPSYLETEVDHENAQLRMLNATFQGLDGVRKLSEKVYSMCAPPRSGCTYFFTDIIVQYGELGYYLDRRGDLHLLGVGPHWINPWNIAKDTKPRMVSLDPPNGAPIHLPPDGAFGALKPCFHIVQVQAGTMIACRWKNVEYFMAAGVAVETADAKVECVGYHFIENDRTFEIVGTVNLSDITAVNHGPMWHIQVPPAHFMKALIGQEPVLLGPGVHNINLPKFRIMTVPSTSTALDVSELARRCLVPFSEPIIVHGNIKIIRVGTSQLCRIFVQNKPILLPHREQPYVFTDQTVQVPDQPFVDVADKFIKHGTLHIVRVNAGELACVWLHNKPYILGAAAILGAEAAQGVDYPTTTVNQWTFTDANFQIKRVPDARGNTNDDRLPPEFTKWSTCSLIAHGTICIINVAQDQVCLAWENGESLILLPRKQPYVFNSSSFRLADPVNPFRSRSEMRISHGIRHYVTVPDGFVTLCSHEGRSMLLGASALNLHIDDMVAQSVLIPTPASETNRNVYYIESSNFTVNNTVAVREKVIQHGLISIVTVEDGHVAVIRNQGRRETLQPGRYLLVEPIKVYERDLYLGVRTVRSSISVYDSQRLEVNVEFVFTWKIADPLRAAAYRDSDSKLQGDDGLQAYLRSVCSSVMRTAVQHTSVLNIGDKQPIRAAQEADEIEQRRAPSTTTETSMSLIPESVASPMPPVSGLGAGAAAGSNGKTVFTEQVNVDARTQVETMMHQLQEVGVIIVDLSIQDWNIINSDIEKAIQSRVTETMTEQLNAARVAAQARTNRITVEADVQLAVTRAEGEARAMTAKIEAENRVELLKAEAKRNQAEVRAAAMKVEAQADSDAALIRADAEAKAIEMRGNAEAAIQKAKVDALSGTPQREWDVRAQEAWARMLAGANVTVTPDGLGQLMKIIGAVGHAGGFSALAAATARVTE